MSFLDRLERRFGAWAIPQFSLFIVMANALIYFLGQVRPEFIGRLMLDPEAVRQGEVWRLVTFLFIPPHLNLVWLLLWLLVLYQFALALEHQWGDFRFCLYYAIGGISMSAAAMGVGEMLPTVPLYTTLFLAFATLFPNYELLLFFIFPVKVKYLAALTWLGLAWGLISGDLFARVAIAASMVNYFLFFGPQIWGSAKRRILVYRNRKRFKREDD